jgi:hypothetical protein
MDNLRICTICGTKLPDVYPAPHECKPPESLSDWATKMKSLLRDPELFGEPPYSAGEAK